MEPQVAARSQRTVIFADEEKQDDARAGPGDIELQTPPPPQQPAPATPPQHHQPQRQPDLRETLFHRNPNRVHINVFSERHYPVDAIDPRDGLKEIKRLCCAIQFLVDCCDIVRVVAKYNDRTRLRHDRWERRLKQIEGEVQAGRFVGNASPTSPFRSPTPHAQRFTRMSTVSLPGPAPVSASSANLFTPTIERPVIQSHTNLTDEELDLYFRMAHSLDFLRRDSLVDLSLVGRRRTFHTGTLRKNRPEEGSSVPHVQRGEHHFWERAMFKEFVSEVETEEMNGLALTWTRMQEEARVVDWEQEHLKQEQLMVVTDLEKDCYKRLCQYVFFEQIQEQLSSTYAEHELVTPMVQRAREALLFLRGIEKFPEARTDNGFVNAVDNWLCALLYRHRSTDTMQGPGAEDSYMMDAFENPMAKTYLEQLRSQSSRELCSTWCRAVSYTVFLAAVVLLGCFALWVVWHDTLKFSLENGVARLTTIGLDRAWHVCNEVFLSPSVMVHAMSSLVLHSDVYWEQPVAGALPSLSHLDSVMFDTLSPFMVSSVFFATPHGSILGISRNTRPGADVFQVVTVDADDPSCLVQFQMDIDSHARTGIGACNHTDKGYDPRMRSWYEGAVASNSTGWTEAYQFKGGPAEWGVTQFMPVFAQPPLNASATDDSFIAVVGVDLKLSLLSEELRHANLPEGGDVFVCDADGNVLASSLEIDDYNNAGTNAMMTAVVDYFNDSHSGVVSLNDVKRIETTDTRYYVASDQIRVDAPGMALFVVAAFDEDSRQSMLNTADLATVVVSVLALLFTLMLALASYKLFPHDREREAQSPRVDPKVMFNTAGQNVLHEFNHDVRTPANVVLAEDDDESDPDADPEDVVLFGLREGEGGGPGELQFKPIQHESLDHRKKFRRMETQVGQALKGSGRLKESGSKRDVVGDSATLRAASGMDVKYQQIDAEVLHQRKQRTRNQRILWTSLVLLVSCFAIIWFIWSNESFTAVAELTRSQVDTTQYGIVEGVKVFVEHAMDANRITLDKLRRGTLGLAGLPADTHFFDMMNSFKRNGTFLVEMLYVGFHENGFFSGAQVWDRDNGTLKIAVRDDSTLQHPFQPGTACYQKFPGDAYGRRIVNDSDLLLGAIDNATLCEYDPRTRPWYIAAMTAGEPVWSDVYVCSDGFLCITAAMPFNLADGSFGGVVATDVTLEGLSTFLSEVNILKITATNDPSSLKQREEDENFCPRYFRLASDGVCPKPQKFIIDGNMQLIASSNVDPGSYSAVIQATDSGVAEIAETGFFFEEKGIVQSGLEGEIRRSGESPLTYLLPIRPCNPELSDCSARTTWSLNWYSVITVPKDYFLEEIDSNRTLTFLMALGAVFAVAYLTNMSFLTWSRTFKPAGALNYLDALDELGKPKLDKEFLSKYMRTFAPQVMHAAAMDWQRKHLQKHSDTHGQPVEFSDVNEHFFERAVLHIADTQKGRNILTTCTLESLTDADGDPVHLPLAVYRLQTNMWWVFCVHIMVGLHILLAFGEVPTNDELRKEGGQKLSIAIIELFCIAVEVIEVAMRFLVQYRWMHKSNFLQPPEQRVVDVCLAVFVGLSLVDWVLALAVPFSFEYLFPVRPFILIFLNNKVLMAAKTFFKSVWAARDVFVLYFCLVVVGAAMGTVLFRRFVNIGALSSSFDNFIRSLTTTFVYISTGENYTDVVYEAYNSSPIYTVYFVLLTLFGMFFTMAMVIGIFQDSFDDMNRSVMRKDKLMERTGIIASFILLDTDGSEELQRSEFKQFMRHVRPQAGMADIERMFEFMNKDADDSIDIKEFVAGVEEISVTQLFLISGDTKQPRWVQWMRVKVFEQKWFEKVVLLVVIVEIWILTLYGTYNDDAQLDLLLSLLMLANFVEITLRVVAFGPREYWHYFDYHPSGRFQMYAHRFELMVVAMSFVGFVSSRIAVRNLVFQDDQDWVRFVLTFPILRVFTHVKRTRYLIFTLFQIIPPFMSVLVLLFVVFYLYGFVGMNRFAHKLDVLLDGELTGNFDSLGSSILLLFQLLVGEGWHEVMYACISATDWISSWYFITFIIMVTLLFTNLIIGLILAVFSRVMREKAKYERETGLKHSGDAVRRVLEEDD